MPPHKCPRPTYDPTTKEWWFDKKWYGSDDWEQLEADVEEYEHALDAYWDDRCSRERDEGER